MSDLLLPPNSTAWERAVEQTSAERHPLPTHLIREFFDPDLCPEHLLGWLAYEKSIDLWDDGWPVEKKRRVIRDWFRLHQIKGTKAGIKRAVALTDNAVVQDVTFPSRSFASATVTKAQRDAWLAKMPEIRIYFVSQRAPRGPDAFMRADPHSGGRSSYVGYAFTRFEAAEAIYGRRSLLRRADGSEQPLRHATIREVDAPPNRPVIDQVRIPGEARPALFAGGYARRGFLHPGRVEPQTATVRVHRESERRKELHWDTLKLGFEPIDLEYRVESERHPAGPAAFTRKFARTRFLMRDRGEELIYQALYLHDPSVDTPWVRAHSFVGHARTPKPAYHSEMLVEARSRAGRRSFFLGRGYIGRQFTARDDLTKYRFALLAGRMFKAARDKLQFDTKTTRAVRFSDRPRLDGSIRFGRPVRRTL